MGTVQLSSLPGQHCWWALPAQYCPLTSCPGSGYGLYDVTTWMRSTKVTKIVNLNATVILLFFFFSNKWFSDRYVLFYFNVEYIRKHSIHIHGFAKTCLGLGISWKYLHVYQNWYNPPYFELAKLDLRQDTAVGSAPLIKQLSLTHIQFLKVVHLVSFNW